jgi:hypothetical protein
MNYLQLAQRLSSEVGASGNGPSSVTGQAGANLRLVNWINTAWLEIQGLHNTWNWMRKPFSWETVANTGDYLPTAITNTLTSQTMSDLRYWYKDTFRCQKKSIGIQDEQWLVEWEYYVFRNTYRFNLQVPGRPVVFAENPQGKAIMLGQVPDDVYIITGEYQKKAYSLVNNTDEPDIPEAYHLMIVYKAMVSYGLFEAAAEVVQRGQAEYQNLLTQLEREQLQEVYLGNPLA